MKNILGFIVISVFVASLLIPSVVLAETTVNPPYDFQTVGVVGCSNTWQHTKGYNEASTLGQLWPYEEITEYAGATLRAWAEGNPNRGGWAAFDAAYNNHGAEAIWIQMCIRDRDSSGETESNQEQKDQLTTLISRVKERVGDDIPIYVSPLNYYASGRCYAVGDWGQPNSVDLADWATSEGLALRGPDTGPLDEPLLRADGCHLSDEGMAFVGAQMADWFDNGGWQNGLDEEAPSVPQNLLATTPNGLTVELDWDDSTDNVGVTNYVVERDLVDVESPSESEFTDDSVQAETTYQYVVYAEDAAGNRSTASEVLQVTTPELGDVVNPTVSIDSPANGSTLEGTVSVELTATDNVAIASVELFIDGSSVAVLTASPYNYSWDTTTVNDGDFNLTAVATDTSGNTAISNAATVTVDNIADPAGQFTASTYNAVVGETITFYDANTDPSQRRRYTWDDGSVTRSRNPVETHSYGSSGTYAVTLETQDVDTGQRAFFTLNIVVE